MCDHGSAVRVRTVALLVQLLRLLHGVLQLLFEHLDVGRPLLQDAIGFVQRSTALVQLLLQRGELFGLNTRLLLAVLQLTQLVLFEWETKRKEN